MTNQVMGEVMGEGHRTSRAVGQNGETPAAARPAARMAAAASDGRTARRPGEATSSNASCTASPATCARQRSRCYVCEVDLMPSGETCHC